MAVMDVRNSSGSWLVMWLEPLGEDRWLRPDEVFRVRSDYDGQDLAFSVDYWMTDDDRAAGIENVNVWIESGSAYAEVTDRHGTIVECGHQRPDDVDRKWKSMNEDIQQRVQRA